MATRAVEAGFKRPATGRRGVVEARAEPEVVSPSRAQKAVLLFLVTFLIVFPKGGIKVGGVPITWGYLGMGLVSLWLPYALLARRAAPLRTARLVAMGMLVPFLAVSWGGILAHGAMDTGFALSFVTTFFVIPPVMLIVLGMHIDRIDLDLLLRAVRMAVLLVSAYGIFLFFYKLATDSFIEIPYLTVNAGDVGELEGKSIDRGGVFKLISTYNNGNVYGISLLMLLPLYTFLEKRLSSVLTVKASLVLTLSRTVWAGLVVYEVLSRLYVRRPTWKTVAAIAGWVSLAAVGVWYALDLLDRDLGFLFDRTLGGRIDQVRYLFEASLLPARPFDVIQEMIYLSVVDYFGLVGLLTFLVGLTGPLVLHLARFLPHWETEYKRSLAVGLIVYLFVAISDGALLYIPVMAIYWFVVSLLLSNNPSFRDFVPAGRRAGTA
ncbi:MAG TPA: hypothetical protein VF167_01665 [Longimicrobiaceae bacterium]